MTSPEPTTDPVPSRPPVKPTARTMQKFSRDFGAAVVGFALAYLVAHKADLGIDPEVAAAIGPLATFGYRWLRSLSGMEPQE